MAFNKKTSRKIVVNDQQYLWKVAFHRRNNSPFLDILVEKEDAGGATLMQPVQTYNSDFVAPKISPADVREAIETAISDGWDPDQAGPQHRLPAKKLNGFGLEGIGEVSTRKSPGHTLIHIAAGLSREGVAYLSDLEHWLVFTDARKKKYFSDLLLKPAQDLKDFEISRLQAFREQAEAWNKTWKEQVKKADPEDVAIRFLEKLWTPLDYQADLKTVVLKPAEEPDIIRFFNAFALLPTAETVDQLPEEIRNYPELIRDQFEAAYIASHFSSFHQYDQGLILINRKEGFVGILAVLAD